MKKAEIEKTKENIKGSSTLILHYVAKSLSLLGSKIKESMKKQKNRVNLFSDSIPMPISMRPNIIVENYEFLNRNKSSNR